MAQLIGEFECKLDNKGRFILPSALKKKIPQEANDKFMLLKGFDNCLYLYPYNEWEKVNEGIKKLNTYVKQNRDFIRLFYSGATEMELDSAMRLLLPKKMQEYAHIEKDIVLFAHNDKIEIWDADTFNKLNAEEPMDLASLAESVMGGNKNE